MNIAVVILAGGEGRRIGGNKPQRSLAGETLLARAQALARLWSDSVRVAIRPGSAADSAEADRLLDRADIEGPLGGLAAGLDFGRSSGFDAILTIPCDSPFLPADLRERLEAGLGRAVAALARSGGRVHPACGLWTAPAQEALAPYLATGRRSLSGFAESVGCELVDWGTEPIDPFLNINDPEDLGRAEAWLRSR